MTYDKEAFLEFLRYLDNKVDRHLEVVAVGGSALSMLDLKAETKDIDIMLLNCSDDVILEIADKIMEKYPEKEVDIWANYKMAVHKDGRIFYQEFPRDCCNTLPTEPVAFKNIELKLLNPLDILVSKIGRNSADDLSDMVSIVRRYAFKKEEVENRFNLYMQSYGGSKSAVQSNFKYVIETLFGS
jgi:hypothetical protein